MGYELHITRADEEGSSNADAEISLEEWRRFVRDDPELVAADAAEAVNRGGEGG